MKNQLALVAVMALSMLSINVLAQQAPEKFGKIGTADLNLAKYEKDTAASAVVLFDYGKSYMTYGADQFQVIFERHTRVKVFNKEGYDYANVSVPIYHSNNGKELVTGLKGITYNLEGGKMVKSKMDKSAVFEEEMTTNWDAVKFTLPNVKEGSVFEYTYTIKSDYLFNYRDWEFQTSIPVKWSEYNASFIEYYQYQPFMQGYIPVTVSDTKSGTQQFTVTTSSNLTAGLNSGRTSGSTDRYTAQTTDHRWAIEHVPAFKKEPYMTSANNYISRIEFEMKGINFPGQPYRPIMNNWNTLNKEFLDDANFGQPFLKSNFLQKEVDPLIAGIDSPEEKMKKVFEFVRRNVAWNGQYRVYLKNGLRKVLDEKKGSSADVNLLLTAMLRKAGLNAEPILISTRNNGFVRQSFPISTQFNYVATAVKLDNRIVTLDATDKLLPMGILPERCLNGTGWIVSQNNPQWIDLTNRGNSSTQVVANFKLDAEGNMTGNVELRKQGYAAKSFRKSYLEKGEEEYVKSKYSSEEWELSNVAFENVKEPNAPVKEKLELAISSEAEALGDMIYLNPMIVGRIENNPFKLENRIYPVDFDGPTKQMHVINLQIPEGYQVDEAPENKAIALPNNSAKFVYNISVRGNQINLVCQMLINKSTFTSEEYPYLKEFYDQIVAKEAEQIVLKKVKN